MRSISPHREKKHSRRTGRKAHGRITLLLRAWRSLTYRLESEVARQSRYQGRAEGQIIPRLENRRHA